MPVNTFSSYAVYLSNLNGFKNLQGSLNELTQQLASGKKSLSLVNYGSDSQSLLGLRAEATKRQSYIDSMNAASTDVKSYDTIFTQMEKIAADMFQAFTSPDSDVPTKQVNTIQFTGDVGDTVAGAAAGRDTSGTGSFAAGIGFSSTAGVTAGVRVPGSAAVEPVVDAGTAGRAADAARLKSTTRRNGL